MIMMIVIIRIIVWYDSHDRNNKFDDDDDDNDDNDVTFSVLRCVLHHGDDAAKYFVQHRAVYVLVCALCICPCMCTMYMSLYVHYVYLCVMHTCMLNTFKSQLSYYTCIHVCITHRYT